jgi:hypothetical protein
MFRSSSEVRRVREHGVVYPAFAMAMKFVACFTAHSPTGPASSPSKSPKLSDFYKHGLFDR